jgi:hypothetical protein
MIAGAMTLIACDQYDLSGRSRESEHGGEYKANQYVLRHCFYATTIKRDRHKRGVLNRLGETAP